MAFSVVDFPGYCTAKIIYEWRNYPGVSREFTIAGAYQNTDTYEGYVAWAKPYLVRACETLNTNEARQGVTNDMRGLALVFSTLRSDQEFAIKFAKEVGFRATKKAKKIRHPESDLVGLFIDTPVLYQWYLDNR